MYVATLLTIYVHLLHMYIVPSYIHAHMYNYAGAYVMRIIYIHNIRMHSNAGVLKNCWILMLQLLKQISKETMPYILPAFMDNSTLHNSFCSTDYLQS